MPRAGTRGRLILCPGYDAPPEADALASATSPRILQLLLQLERAADWTTARALAQQIDRESRDELPIIPLWQLGDHYAWRDRLTGPAKEAGELYQGIETWEIVPWIAKDSWETSSRKSMTTPSGDPNRALPASDVRRCWPCRSWPRLSGPARPGRRRPEEPAQPAQESRTKGSAAPRPEFRARPRQQPAKPAAKEGIEAAGPARSGPRADRAATVSDFVPSGVRSVGQDRRGPARLAALSNGRSWSSDSSGRRGR